MPRSPGMETRPHPQRSGVAAAQLRGSCTSTALLQVMNIVTLLMMDQARAVSIRNVTYATNVSLFNPFRPELGKMDPIASGKRLAGNLPWLVMAVGETLSASAETWPLRRLQARLLGRQAITPAENAANPALAAGGGNEPSFITTYALFGIPLLGLVAITAVGLTALVRRRAWLLFLIITATLLLVWLTPWPVQFPRYLMPLMPFLTICAALGFLNIYRSLANSSRLKRIGLPVFWVLVLVCAVTHVIVPIKLFRERSAPFGVFLASGIGETPRFFAHDRSWQDWEEAVTWIGANTPGETIVATSAPHLLYLSTNRRAFRRWKQIRNVNGTCSKKFLSLILIVDQLAALDVTRRYALPAMKEASGWNLAHAIDKTRIYQRTGNADDGSP